MPTNNSGSCGDVDGGGGEYTLMSLKIWLDFSHRLNISQSHSFPHSIFVLNSRLPERSKGIHTTTLYIFLV